MIKNNPAYNQKSIDGKVNFLGSPYSITTYFVLIILISLFAFFKLFPEYGYIVSNEGVVIEDLSTQDTVVQITGNIKPILLNNQTKDSFNLELNVARRIFKDTASSNSGSVSTKHAVSFSLGSNSHRKILWLILIVGIIGASIHAITSLSEFVGNGSFDSKWALWYYLRPFVGALLSLIFYLLIRAGIFTIDSTNDLYGILAIAGIIGMFSKQALYKISDIANALFTSQHEENLKGKLSESSPPKISGTPIKILAGTSERTITLRGEHFTKNTKVFLAQEELPILNINSTELQVTLPEKSIEVVGELVVLRIINPPPGGGETTTAIKVIGPVKTGGSTENSEGIEEVVHYDELEHSEQYTLIEEYIDKNLDSLKKQFKTITGAYAGKKKIGGNEIELISLVIQVPIKEDLDEPIPEYVDFKGYKIPTDVEIASTVMPTYAKKPLEKGVKRINHEEFGTLGFPVLYNEKLHVLSCYHVFFNKELSSGVTQISEPSDTSYQSLMSPPKIGLSEKQEIIGEVISGMLNNFLDVAIMKPSSQFLQNLRLNTLPKGYRILRRENENKSYLKFWGQGSNRLVLSKVLNISVTVYVDYEFLPNYKIRGLIKMEKGSVPGDSGAAVYDSGGDVVGIILGSDSHFSYAISAYSIFSKTDFKPL